MYKKSEFWLTVVTDVVPSDFLRKFSQSPSVTAGKHELPEISLLLIRNYSVGRRGRRPLRFNKTFLLYHKQDFSFSNYRTIPQSYGQLPLHKGAFKVRKFNICRQNAAKFCHTNKQPAAHLIRLASSTPSPQGEGKYNCKTANTQPSRLPLTREARATAGFWEYPQSYVGQSSATLQR